MAVRVDPQRRRLSVAQSEPVKAGAPRPAVGRDRLEASGLTEFLDASKLGGRKALCIYSKTDQDLKRRASFTEKDTEVIGPEGEDTDALLRWAHSQLVAWSCRKGLKPESPNQDSFSVLLVEGEFSLYCVYDGHGPCGHDVSDLVRERLQKMFLSSPKRSSDIKKAFEEAFVGCQKEVEETSGLDASMSGTTCTLAYHDLKTDTLSVAHVGDSRCVIGCKLKAGGTSADELTVDHKPNLESEKRRIESSNPPGRVVFDGFYNHRVFAQNGMYPGLNMSRAIGDVVGHKEAGLTAMPDVKVVDLKAMRAKSPGVELTLLLCTDGVWEFIESEEAVKLTLDPSHNSFAEAAERLAKESWNRQIGRAHV